MVTPQVIRSYHSLTVGRSIDWTEASLVLPQLVSINEAQALGRALTTCAPAKASPAGA
jgi:hypothetical protein